MKTRTLILALATTVLWPFTAEAQSPQLCSSPYSVEQAFPTSGPEVSRWTLCWQVLNGPNLVITGAWFRPTPTSSWIKVLYDGRVSQLVVPYHAGSPRFLDVSYGFPPVSLNASDCPAPGEILGAASEICKVVHDRGLMWKHKVASRRAEELVLWSVLAAANYDYVVEWTFRDDGVIAARFGATGHKWNDDTHVHAPIWRLDIDLNGACCDTALWMSHKEVGPNGLDSMTPISNATGLKWDPVSWNMIHVRDATLKNANGHPSEWSLMPLRMGTPRHAEPYTANVFWVTPYVWSQMSGDQLPSYIRGAAPTQNADVVLWYYGGLHHVIRDEDTGVTLTMFDGGFQLMPFNVWPNTPFYP
jgi:Cu2+-containing amine oxidase